MTYNNPYQNPYLNPYYPTYMAPQVAPVAPQTAQPTVPQMKLDTVSGRTAADVYEVAIGQEAILFDIDNPVIYKKQRGTDGKLTMDIYDLTRRESEQKEEPQKIDLNEYMKADAIQSLVEKRVKEEVEKRLSEISFTPKSTRSKASKGDEQE